MIQKSWRNLKFFATDKQTDRHTGQKLDAPKLCLLLASITHSDFRAALDTTIPDWNLLKSESGWKILKFVSQIRQKSDTVQTRHDSAISSRLHPDSSVINVTMFQFKTTNFVQTVSQNFRMRLDRDPTLTLKWTHYEPKIWMQLRLNPQET